MVASLLTSACGVLAMMKEPDPTLKLHALNNLNILVDRFWSEISCSTQLLVNLVEDDSFGQQELASLVLSKVYFYLNDMDTSLKYAFRAGRLFDVTQESLYTQTVVGEAIDHYISLQKSETPVADMDWYEALEAIFEKMIDRCIMLKKHKEAIGMAIEGQRLEKLKEAIEQSDDMEEALSYCINVSHAFVSRRDYLHKILRVVIELYQELKDWEVSNRYAINMCGLLMFMEDADGVLDILFELLGSKSEDDELPTDIVGNELYAERSRNVKKIFELKTLNLLTLCLLNQNTK